MEANSAHIGEILSKTSYLVLTQAMAWIQNDPVARHIVVTRWTVVKAIVKHSSILQLEVR